MDNYFTQGIGDGIMVGLDPVGSLYATIANQPDLTMGGINYQRKFDGSIGPSLHGSSFELIRLRMLYGKYPDGHKPKRTTTDMPEFEDLKDDIPALHAFLNQ